MFVPFGGKLMTLGLELPDLIRKLLDLKTVHQKGNFYVVAVKKVHEPPDANTVTIFPFGDCSHVPFENRIGRRGRATLPLE